jgi:hypothetical protein
MSKKIEKLKEVNKQINEMLIELEARVFVACGEDVQSTKSKKEMLKVITKPKQ